MKKTYEQLTSDERDKIAIYGAHGYNQSDIAKILGRNRSTISRELSRNKSSKLYLPHRAQKQSERIRRESRKKERMKNPKIRDYVHTKLKEEWSPEQIAGRITLDNPELSVSHEAIYQYIYEQQPDLINYLPRNHRKRRKRSGSPKAKTIIPRRIFIDERPKGANDRTQMGHWEADCIVSGQNQKSLAVLCERTSRYLNIQKIKNKQAPVFARAVILRLRLAPEFQRRSITYDNGSENVLHLDINDAINTDSYFCHPYHSWEKGTVENSIGLIRRFFPKKTNFAKISSAQIAKVEFLLNHRPRKALNFQTPFEIFSSAVALTG